MDGLLDSLVGDSRRAVPGLLKSLEAQRTVLEDRVGHSSEQHALHAALCARTACKLIPSSVLHYLRHFLSFSPSPPTRVVEWPSATEADRGHLARVRL